MTEKQFLISLLESAEKCRGLQRKYLEEQNEVILDNILQQAIQAEHEPDNVIFNIRQLLELKQHEGA